MEYPYKIHQFFRPEELTPPLLKFLRYPFVAVPLPTKVIVTKPGCFVPNMARVYATYLLFYDGMILTHQELLDKVSDAIYYVTTNRVKGVKLTEIWSNWEDDRYAEYSLRGFQLQPDGEINCVNRTNE